MDKLQDMDLTLDEARTRTVEPGITYYVMEIPELPGYGCGYRLSPDGLILHFMTYHNRAPMKDGWFWAPYAFDRPAFNLDTGDFTPTGFEGGACPVDFMLNMIRGKIQGAF